jgi:hypothetical protein
MKWFLRIAVACAAWLIAQTPAAADFWDGNQLFAECRTSSDSPTYYQSASNCRSYITGVFDDFMLQRVVSGKSEDCVIGNITAGQLRDVVDRYLYEHPQTRAMPASFLTRMAIIDAWPACSLSR